MSRASLPEICSNLAYSAVCKARVYIPTFSLGLVTCSKSNIKLRAISRFKIETETESLIYYAFQKGQPVAKYFTYSVEKVPFDIIGILNAT